MLSHTDRRPVGDGEEGKEVRVGKRVKDNSQINVGNCFGRMPIINWSCSIRYIGVGKLFIGIVIRITHKSLTPVIQNEIYNTGLSLVGLVVLWFNLPMAFLIC